MSRQDEWDRGGRGAVTLKKRSRGAARWLLFTLLLAAAAVWFAPTIVAKTSLRNQLVTLALPDFPGQVSIGSASAGWMSPVELRDVAVWDSAGQPIARIPLVTSTKQLSRLAANLRELGTFQLFQPELQIVVTENSSNLEELIQPFMSAGTATTEKTTGTSPSLGLTVSQGRVLITDVVTQQTCTVENLELQVQVPSGAPAPLTVNLTADAQYLANLGNLSANVTWHQPTELTATDLGDGHVQLISQGFPLAALQPLWRRTGADLDLQGQFVSNLDCRWKRSERGPELQAQGNLGINEPQIRLPSALGSDQIRMQRMAATIDVQVADNMVNVQDIQLSSDIAKLQVSGSALLDELMAGDSRTTKLLDWQSSHNFRVRGEIDVAALAGQLPETLRLKEGMRITQGQATLDVDSHIELGQRVFKGTVQTSRIAATTHGRTVSWDQPVHLAVGGVSSAEGLQVQQLDCQSDFLRINGAGKLDQGQLTATGDLAKLVTQVGQFSDLGDLQLAGRMTAEATWQRTSPEQCQGSLQADIREFSMASSQLPPLTESHLTLQAEVQGAVAATGGVQRLDAATLQVLSGDDKLTARLTQPVAKLSANSAWPLHCQLTGHTESWLARLRPWGVTVPGWEIRSKINAMADGTFQAEQVALAACQVSLENLSASSRGWLIREPTVEIDGSLQWQAAGNQITAPSVTFTSSSLSARAENVHVIASSEQTAASGVLAFRGDLARLAGWQYADQPPTSRPRGQFQGQAQLATEQGGISFSGTTDVTGFVYEQVKLPLQAISDRLQSPANWVPVWAEPSIRCVTGGLYQPSTDHLKLQQLEVTADGLALATIGNLANLTTQPTADLRGEISYDLAVITSKLSQQLGPNIRLQGQKRQPFTVSGPLQATSLSMSSSAPAAENQLASAQIPAGPLVPNELSAEATLAWDAIQAYGITIGPQEVNTRLQQGTVFFSPLQVGAAQGTVSVAPRLELNASPMSLVIDQGKVIEGIQITPQMCETWFKYITPILAGTATAEGQMSMSLQGARVPLDNPLAASIAGTTEIHGARVQPGPMAQQLLGTIREVATIVNQAAPSLSFLQQGENWLELQPQNVDFQMSQGRVFHRNLEFTSGQVKVRTQGWVGVDQSIGLLAEIPILDEWVAGEKILAPLQGQTIKIPIEGTFAQPRIDRRAVGQLSQQLVGNAAEQLIQGQLQKGLEKLLGPK